MFYTEQNKANLGREAGRGQLYKQTQSGVPSREEGGLP
jgi:hypothetical protein